MYETLVHGSSATRVTLEPETIFVSHIEGPGGGHSPIKVTGVLVEKFREHPQKVPESCFMDMSQIHFHPPPPPLPARYQFNNNKLYNWHCKF